MFCTYVFHFHNSIFPFGILLLFLLPTIWRCHSDLAPLCHATFAIIVTKNKLYFWNKMISHQPNEIAEHGLLVNDIPLPQICPLEYLCDHHPMMDIRIGYVFYWNSANLFLILKVEVWKFSWIQMTNVWTMYILWNTMLHVPLTYYMLLNSWATMLHYRPCRRSSNIIYFTVPQIPCRFWQQCASCYNRIIVTLAPLVSLKLGYHQNKAWIKASTLQEARYKLKTRTGMSARLYLHSHAIFLQDRTRLWQLLHDVMPHQFHSQLRWPYGRLCQWFNRAYQWFTENLNHIQL